MEKVQLIFLRCTEIQNLNKMIKNRKQNYHNKFLWWPFMTFDIQKLWSEQSGFDVWWFVGMKLHRFSDLKTCWDIKSDKTHPNCSSQPALKNQNTDNKHNVKSRTRSIPSNFQVNTNFECKMRWSGLVCSHFIRAWPKGELYCEIKLLTTDEVTNKCPA